MTDSFEFTPENTEKANSYIARYPEGRQWSAVLPLLDLAQRQNRGHLTEAAIRTVSRMLEMPYMRVMEVATFYTMLNLREVGKYHLQCCITTPCWLRGSNDIVAAVEKHLGIGMNEMTADGMFSLVQVECLGACVNAPILQVNDDFYEDLTAESVVELLESLKKGEQPEPGSVSGRQGSAPEGGPTTLTELTFADE